MSAWSLHNMAEILLWYNRELETKQHNERQTLNGSNNVFAGANDPVGDVGTVSDQLESMKIIEVKQDEKNTQ